MPFGVARFTSRPLGKDVNCFSFQHERLDAVPLGDLVSVLVSHSISIYI